MASVVEDGTIARAGGGAEPLEQCGGCLDALVSQSASMIFACVGTVDGRLATAHGARHGSHTAATTGCLLALSESFAREALRSHCVHSTIVTRHGAIVTVRIPSARNGYMLSVGTDATETPALVLHHALDAAERLASILDSTA